MQLVTQSQHPIFFRFLQFNGIFSMVCALFIAATADQLPVWLNFLFTDFYNVLAGGLFVFAVRLLWLVHQKSALKLEAWGIVVGDFVWVVVSAVLLISDLPFTLTAFWAIDAIALCVLIFSVGQSWGLIWER